MNLVKWNPFRELEVVSNRLNSLFGKLPVRAESGADMLTIPGRRHQENEEKNKRYHRLECACGSFARSFRMPDDAD
jgi:HSP20 family protein